MSRKKTHYIYFLIKRKRVVYIGCSHDVGERIRVHRSNKPHGKVRVMGPYTKEFAFRNEARLIKIFNPEYNLGFDNAGRKPVEPSEKVKLVGFYTKQKFIDKVGGIEKAREMAKNFIENEYIIAV